MILTRTPFRISFFGGGTDYPAWFHVNGGAVVSATIDKYCWISCRKLPPFFEHKSRIIYSHVENVMSHDEIKHPSARECLKLMGIDYGIEIHHDGDLPARTGLGSSSSFTVGMLLSLNALNGKMVTKEQLAFDAIKVEQDILKENVGCQDQVAASYGGINLVEFSKNRMFHVNPVPIAHDRMRQLNDRLLLFYTGLSRISSEVAAEQVKNMPKKEAELRQIQGMVKDGLKILTGTCDLSEFGMLLHKAWMTKKSLSSRISNDHIDSIYKAAMDAGALGGKLLGAGGGGFMLFYAEPDKKKKVIEKLKDFLYVPFDFEHQGAQIVYYEP